MLDETLGQQATKPFDVSRVDQVVEASHRGGVVHRRPFVGGGRPYSCQQLRRKRTVQRRSRFPG